MNFHGRTVLVTGGTAGIGEALIAPLLERGCHQVIICGRQQDALDRLGKQLGVHAIRCDLSVAEEVIRLAKHLAKTYPALSVVINNAGVQHEIDLVGMSDDALCAIAGQEIQINYLSPVLLNKLLLGTLSAQTSSAIINITTPLALSPKKSAPFYCASKTALRSYTKTLRFQLAETRPHIRVIEVQPPLVDTAMTAGRGRGKISPQQMAKGILHGFERGQTEIYVGKAKVMKFLHRWVPGVAESITKRW